MTFLLACIIMVNLFSNEHILVAHRAADKTMPENTLESMVRMEEKGAKWFEIDCYLMKDGNIAVIHDITLERTTTGRGKITSKTIEDLADVFVVGGDGERIPMLDHMMAYAHMKNLHVMIEVKDKNLEIVKKIDDLISAYNSDLFIIYSFHKKIVKAFAELQPTYSVRWNMDRLTKSKLNLAKKLGIGINLNRRLLDKSDIEKLTAAGLDLHVFTVNSKRRAKELVGQGVTAIITDTLFTGEVDGE